MLNKLIELKRKNSTDTKSARSYEDGFSKDRLEIQDKPRFRKRFSNHVPSKFPKDRKYRVSNPRSHKGKGSDS